MSSPNVSDQEFFFLRVEAADPFKNIVDPLRVDLFGEDFVRWVKVPVVVSCPKQCSSTDG